MSKIFVYTIVGNIDFYNICHFAEPKQTVLE